MIKPITNHIHPVTVEELETIHAHVNGTFAPSSIAKEREAYASGQEASANLFELVAAAMPEKNTKVLCNIDLSAPIEQLQAEIAALRVWAYGDDETAHQQPAGDGTTTTEWRLLPPSNGRDNNWHITDCNDTMVLHAYGFNHAVDEDSKRLAIRAHACLTACQGVSNQELRLSAKLDGDMLVKLSNGEAESIKLAMAQHHMNMDGMAEDMLKDVADLAERFDRPEHSFSFASLRNALSADLD